MAEHQLGSRIMTLRTLDAGAAGFWWSDPQLNTIALQISQRDFHRLGRPGYLRVTAEVVYAADIEGLVDVRSVVPE